MDEGHQFAVAGGYDQVIVSLAADCARLGVQFRLRAEVRAIRWGRGRVEVIARHGRTGAKSTHHARAVVVSLPLGVLQARSGLGAVRFAPALRKQQVWIDHMQMGHVVRFIFRFRARMWRRITRQISSAPQRGGFGFVHSQVKGVPVWWSLSDQPVMVGWAGGPAARTLLRLKPAKRRQRAINSLGEILGIAAAELRGAVVGWKTHDWTHDPFTRGAYSFTAAGQDKTAERLRQPVNDTLFFAGEAVAQADEVGTVNGALTSGIRAGKLAGRATRASRRTSGK
jgi:monoamine oxidase